MQATILVVDDARDERENISEMLEMAGYRVLTGSNGLEAVRIALENKPDLIICDIGLPKLDGFGVLHLLQRKEGTGDVPFIFLSARTERSYVRKGMEMGADDYIAKPFDPAELLHAIATRLKRSRQLQQDFTNGSSGAQLPQPAATTKELIDTLLQNRNTNKFRKNEHIYSMGNHPAYLFFVLAGVIKTCRFNDSAKQIITHIYNEGDFLGYPALLQNVPYADDAEALSDCEISLIPRSEFESLVYRNIGVMRIFLKMLTANADENDSHLLSLAYSSLRKKVAEALLFLDRKYNSRQLPGFSIDIGRDTIAALAGVTKESIIRTLAEFRDERLISVSAGSIHVTDRKKLERMIN
ncbi:response regulator [Chitinophaga lutea]|uniref:Response regulator n=1 Tax=Chitinophaga lutea TaxID=2488634 RepID=A0A3N4QAX9_9BACT|nr:response regulator [Chitinophaga lutea]RPE08904.1 response regulator [Chitinophaga lutea]